MTYAPQQVQLARKKVKLKRAARLKYRKRKYKAKAICDRIDRCAKPREETLNERLAKHAGTPPRYYWLFESNTRNLTHR